MYSYVRNSTIVHTDPSGRRAVPGSAMYGSDRCKYLCEDRAGEKPDEGVISPEPNRRP